MDIITNKVPGRRRRAFFFLSSREKEEEETKKGEKGEKEASQCHQQQARKWEGREEGERRAHYGAMAVVEAPTTNQGTHPGSGRQTRGRKGER